MALGSGPGAQGWPGSCWSPVEVDHVPYRHINQKRQFGGFSQALTFIQSIALLEKHSICSLDVGDFC